MRRLKAGYYVDGAVAPGVNARVCVCTSVGALDDCVSGNWGFCGPQRYEKLIRAAKLVTFPANEGSLRFQMLFMLLFSRQGKLRLQKWYMAYPDKVKKKITRELVTTILARKPKMCSFLEWKDCKIVYKR